MIAEPGHLTYSCAGKGCRLTRFPVRCGCPPCRHVRLLLLRGPHRELRAGLREGRHRQVRQVPPGYAGGGRVPRTQPVRGRLHWTAAHRG